MRKGISKAIREQVAQRALYKCEYCLLSENLSFYKFHVEHIKSIKHGGNADLDNLALCCPDCNFSKGSDIGTFDESDENIIRFFNPRKDVWHNHFEFKDYAIQGKSKIGIATVKILKFNDPERLIFRQQVAILGLYP